MRILHITPNIDAKKGGSVSAIKNIISIERKIGFDSTVLGLDFDGVRPTLFDNADLMAFSPSFPKRFSRSKKANNWLRGNANNCDLVQVHTIWGFLQIETPGILNKLGVPYVMWPHGSLDPFDLRKKRHLKKIIGPIIIRKVLERSAAVICTTKLEADLLEKYGAKCRTKVLPLSVNPSKGHGNREEFRNKYGISSSDFVLLFLSLICYKKGINLLILAVKNIANKYSNIKLVIAGSDLNGYERQVKEWIKKYQVEDRVIMTGFLSGQDKINAFAGSDCFVLPSMNENFGIAVVESLSNGLPVLISNNVYIWKEIIQSNSGWVCEYSHNSLMKQIMNILGNPKDILEKKNNASKAAEQFYPDNLKNLYKNVYRDLLTNNG